MPGAAEFAYPIVTLEAAERLWATVEATPPSAAVAVVGAGPTGIETAAELAETGRAVTRAGQPFRVADTPPSAASSARRWPT